MAQKPYPTNYPPPPPAYTAPGTTVYVQQQRPVVVTKPGKGVFDQIGQELERMGDSLGNAIDWSSDKMNRIFPTTQNMPSKRGLLGQIGHEINLIGKSVTREADSAANLINKSLATAATGPVLGLFQSGNEVMLISRASGRSIQIVQSPTGLVVDGTGITEGGPFNAVWTVVNEGANQVRLHNNNNFLAVINGATIVMNLPPGATHGIETKFQMSQIGQFITFESLKERGKHLGVLPTGQLKPALATGKEDHAQFGIRLLRSPHGVQTHVVRK